MPLGDLTVEGTSGSERVGSPTAPKGSGPDLHAVEAGGGEAALAAIEMVNLISSIKTNHAVAK